MARRPRASRLETRTARLKLAVREKPYEFTTISPGIALGYRRNRAAGTWVVRVADGHGGNWTKRVSIADDFEEADGEHVLTWWQAIDKARKLARGSDAEAGRPATVADAVGSYERDLIARGGSIANAGRIRKHLTPTLAAKPVGLLTARDLSRWRDGLLDNGMKRQTCLRLCKATKAALNLAARRDPRIRNEKAWRDALSGLGETFATRNAQALTDAQVHTVIAAAYAESEPFGLYVEVAAHTGARLGQIRGLVVSDLQAERLMVPSSRKGRRRKITKKPLPIAPHLAVKLKAAAGNRPPHEPLLLRADGEPWGPQDHARPFAQAAAHAGLQITAYSLRHAAIIRAIVSGVPLRICAALFDTSTSQIEATYSPCVLDHADTIARRGLLAPSPPAVADHADPVARPALLETPPLTVGRKVVPLAGRRS